MYRRSRKLSIQQHEELIGILFIIPYTIGFMIFHLIPVLGSLVIGTTNMRFMSNMENLRFIGITNFINLLNDTTFIESFLRSITFTVIYVPLVIVSGLLMALLINSKIWGRNIVRTALFLPYVSNFVAIAIVWSLLLDFQSGPINQLLMSLGVEKPPLWLLGESTVLPTVATITAWQSVGLFMVTYLAALQGVPRHYYEAAEIDGAGKLKQFFYITVPLISPTTFFLLITALTVSFKNFTQIHVLTNGGPGQASTTLPINIFVESFTNGRLGYATSQALTMFVVIMMITVIQWRGQKKWVNY